MNNLSRSGWLKNAYARFDRLNLFSQISLLILLIVLISLPLRFIARLIDNVIQPTSSESEKYTAPASQKEMVKILNNALSTYLPKEGNSALEDSIKSTRDKEICDFFSNNKKIDNWIGYVSEINSAGNGIGVSLRVKVDFSNEKYTALYFTQYEIKKGSPIYDKILNLKPKDRIIFSGTPSNRSNLESAMDKVSDAVADFGKIDRNYRCDNYVFGVTSDLHRIDIKFNFTEI